MQQVRSQEWRRFGFGGPPEPWDHGALRDLDRLATSYFLDILESHRVAITVSNEDDLRKRIEIFDRYALVEVPDLVADEIIGALRAGSIRGRRFPVHRDRDVQG